MSAEVHFILQGKGGVGKSVVARMIVEFLIHTKTKYIGYDADAVNASLAAVDGYDVNKVDLLSEGEVDPRRFDEIIAEIEEMRDTSIVIDCGASSFLPIVGYIENADVIAVLSEAGYEVFIHTVVTAGSSKVDTFSGYRQLSSRFSDDCNIVVWTNPIYGDVEEEGIAFEQVSSVTKSIEDGSLLGVIKIPKLPRMNQQDFADFLEQNTTFSKATAKDNKSVNTMIRRRLSKIHAQLMSQIGLALSGDDEAESRENLSDA